MFPPDGRRERPCKYYGSNVHTHPCSPGSTRLTIGRSASALARIATKRPSSSSRRVPVHLTPPYDVSAGLIVTSSPRAWRKDERMHLHISTQMCDYGYLGQNGLDDQVVALMLTTTWATRTGRMLRPVHVSELSPDELIAFWADDQPEDPTGSAGGHYQPRWRTASSRPARRLAERLKPPYSKSRFRLGANHG